MNKIINIILILLVFIPFNLLAADFSLFNDKPIYDEPLAYPRTPDTGFSVNTSRYLGERVGYLEASLGKNIPVATMQINDVMDKPLLFQLGLAAGFWGTLGYDEGAFPLLTEDFLISIPLEFRWGSLSGAIKFNHISAHQGDGFEDLLEDNLSKKDKRDLDLAEDLLEEFAQDKDVGITLREPLSYSRDFFSFHLAYEGNFGVFKNRFYSHMGYAHKIIPDTLNRWFAGSGFETVYPSTVLSPYYAQDVTWNGDTDSVDLSVEMGFIILPNKTKHYTLRLALTGYVGTDRRGQLIDNKLKQFGIGFFIY